MVKQKIELEDLTIVARVQNHAYWFGPAGTGTPTGLYRDIVRTMLQHALDSLDGSVS